jgi:hypothetical protein
VTAGRCQIWVVSRTGKNSPSRFCDCVTCAQGSVRPGIVVKEKDVCHVPVRANSTDAVAVRLKLCLISSIPFKTALAVHCHCSCRPSASRLVSLSLFHTTLKMPDPTSHIHGMFPIHTVQARLNFYGTNIFGNKEFYQDSLLHTCTYYICHFELLVACAHVTDPSATLVKLETSTVHSVTCAAFCSAGLERKTWRHYFPTAPRILDSRMPSIKIEKWMPIQYECISCKLCRASNMACILAARLLSFQMQWHPTFS